MVTYFLGSCAYKNKYYNHFSKILQNNLTQILKKNHPTLPYYKVKYPQKRHFVIKSTEIIVGGGLSLGIFIGPLAIFTFGLSVFCYMADTGGGGGGTDVNIADPMLPILVDMLNDVNTYRRNLMHQFRENPSLAQNMLQLLNSNHNLFAGNHPILQVDYENIQDITRRIIIQNIQLDSYRFADQATRFGSAIGPWDDLADELERLIRNLDPNFDFGSDTDSEDIEQAADEIAKRGSKDSEGGAGSAPR